MATPQHGGLLAHDGDGDGGTLRAASAVGVTSPSDTSKGLASAASQSPATAEDAAGYTIVRHRRARKPKTSPSTPKTSHLRPPPADSSAQRGPRGRSKYSLLDRSIFQLMECLRKEATPAATVSVFGRVQRLHRTKKAELDANYEREYDATSSEDCAALHAILHKWLIIDRIRLSAFKLRLDSFRVLNAEPEDTSATSADWRAALTASPPAAPAASSSDMEIDMDTTDEDVATTSVVCAAITDALQQRRVRGVLVVQLEGNMRFHPDSSFQAKLRQLTDISPELARTHRDLKRLLVNATYDADSNRLFLYLRTREDAERWAGTLVSLQGRLLTLCLPSTQGTSTSASIDVQVYKFRAYNLGGNLNMLDIWHLFHGLLGFQVEHLAVATPLHAADADPQLWDVHLRSAGCPPMLKGKTRVVWGAETIWLHHTAFSLSPPCTRCASATHPRRLCKGGAAHSDWTLQVSGPKIVVSDDSLAAVGVTPEALDEAARDEERRMIECSLMAGEDRPAPSVTVPAPPSAIIYSTPQAEIRRKRFDVLRARCQELALPERLCIWRLLAETDSEWRDYQDQFRLQPPPERVELSFLQLLRKTSMWQPDSNVFRPHLFTSTLSRALTHDRSLLGQSIARHPDPAGAHTDPVIYDLDSDTSPSCDSDDDAEAHSEPTAMEDEPSMATVPIGPVADKPDRAVHAPAPVSVPDATTVQQTPSAVDFSRIAHQRARSRAADRGRPRSASKVGQVGKAQTVHPTCSTPARASKDAVKFAATNRSSSQLLRENPETGDVEQMPHKVTQLTVSRFFAPRVRPHSATRSPSGSAPAAAARAVLSAPRPPELIGRDLPAWARLKTALTAFEIGTPANGSCYYYAVGAAKINMCPDRFTCRDRKMKREGGYYRREINLAILARLQDLLDTGTFDREHLCRRFLSAGQPQSELLAQMERHFRAAAATSCVEPCSTQYWAHEEEILGTAYWFGEPLFVFEVLPDDRVFLQVFRGTNGQRGARGEYWPVERGITTIRQLITARVLPLMLAYYPGGTAERPAGHFNALRLSPKCYLEWAGTANRRTRMAKRRMACLAHLGLLPLAADDTDGASSGASSPTSSAFQPSQELTDVTVSPTPSDAASPGPTPDFPASPVTPSSPPDHAVATVILQRLRSSTIMPESLELPFKKFRHANKMAYLKWRDRARRADASSAADLRTVATPEDACGALIPRPNDAVDMLHSLPHRLITLAQLDDQVLTSLGRALVCEARLSDLKAYAGAATTPRRRASAVTAWVTAGEALSRLDARWGMLHDDSRWRRLLPALYRIRRAPAGIPDADLCRLVLMLQVTSPDYDPQLAARPLAEQASALIAWLAEPDRASVVAATSARLAVRDWSALPDLHTALRQHPARGQTRDAASAEAAVSRC